MKVSRFAAAVVLAALPATALANQVGSVAAVNREMDGTPPEASKRALILGNEIYRNERIQTSPIGSGQLMFQDQTTLSVAPQSDIILDEYAYDPDRQAGDIQLSIGRGMLRLVGGRITKKNAAIIRTPTATVGIRGGMVLVEVLADGTTRVVLLAGEFAWIEEGDGEDARKVYLSRPNAEAEIGAGGRVVFRGLVTPDALARYFSRLEGAGTGGSDVGANAASEVEAKAADVAAVNSGIEGGERRQPVSTSGEQPVDGDRGDREDVRDEDEFETAGDQTGGGTNPPPDPGGGTNPDPNPPPTGGGGGPVVTPPILPATGGVFFSGQDPNTFTNIAQGSLIGTDILGRTVRIPVAESREDFSDLSLVSGIESFSLGSNRENAGIVIFDETAGATSSQFGTLEGFGYSDLDEDFHFYQFESIPADPTSGGDPVPGFALFGNPSVSQLRDFTFDDGTLDGQIQNVVEVFEVDNLVDFVGPLESPPAFLVKNGDIDRAGRGAGSHLIFADERVRDGGFGLQVSEFGVYIGRDRSSTAFHTEGSFISTENDAGTFLFSNRPFQPIQTESGVGGRTVFGSNQDYIVLGPVTGLPGNQVFDPGFIRPIGGFEEPGEFGGVLLERDASAAELINDPVPLAGQNIFRNDGLFDAGAISGIAVCSNGNCGAFDETGAREGFYALRGGYGPSVRLQFDSGALDNNDFELVRLQLSDGNLSNVEGVNDFFEFRATQSGESAYVDDRRFAVSQADAPQTLAGVNSTLNSATLILASSELIGFELTGDGGVKDVDISPEFVRWGRWSASLDISDGQTAERREDLVHMGNFVTGIAPDSSLLPSDGIAFYEGIATGTEFDFNTDQFRQVNGTFAMDYNFRAGAGTIEIDLDTGVFTGLPLVGSLDNPASFGTSINTPDFNVDITGGFFAGGGDQVAATGGEFVIEQNVSVDHTRTVGVFAGDRLISN